MGKSGPCCHCGVTSTPLWRNGPPDKPVLCNACGTRWRTKGTLIHYTPIHVREQFDPEDDEVSIVKHTQYKLKEKRSSKVNQHYRAPRNECELPYADQNFRKALEGDTSNRSSSGSAISYSESCANFESTEASHLTGSVQSNVWESPKIASKYIRAKPTQFEMLTKELQTIMHEQQSSDFSSPTDLLFENESVMGSFEISTGSVLLKNSYPKVKEEESEDAKNKPNSGGTKEVIITNYSDCSVLTPLKRVRDIIDESKSSMRNLKRMVKSCGPSHANPQLINYGAKEIVDNNGSFFTPESTFTLPPEKSSVLCSFLTTDEENNSNHDLLIYDKSMNSYPECELVTLLADAEESRTSFPNSISRNQTPKN